MIEFVHHAFGFVCGQPVGRTWPLDGEWLPFCQRCTGIYIGAIVALALQLAFRIRSGSRLLVVHGFLLLQIAPFGLHIIPDTGILRTITGMAFSFGLIGFLWLLPQEHLNLSRSPSASALWRFTILALFSALGVILAVTRGGTKTAFALSLLGLLGLCVLLLLSLVNLGLLASSLLNWLRIERLHIQ